MFQRFQQNRFPDISSACHCYFNSCSITAFFLIAYVTAQKILTNSSYASYSFSAVNLLFPQLVLYSANDKLLGIILHFVQSVNILPPTSSRSRSHYQQRKRKFIEKSDTGCFACFAIRVLRLLMAVKIVSCLRSFSLQYCFMEL